MVGKRLIHLITGTSDEHERRAERIAEALVSRWKRLEAAGQGWTEDDIATAFRSVGEVPPVDRRCRALATTTPTPTPTRVGTPVTPGAADGPLLHDCVDRFKLSETERFESGEISDDSHFLTLQLADKAKEGMPNVPINTLTNADLDKMRQHWTKRPNRKATDKRIALATVKHLIRVTKTVLKYCKKHEGWTPPPEWMDSFPRLSVNNMLTLSERKTLSGKKPKFDADDLQMLWHQAVPVERLFLGLGLFAGHGSEEIATLLKADVVVEDDGVYIDRLRHKTGVHGRWWLPPEVGDLLLKEMAKTRDNPEGLALLGRRGRPLVHRGDTNRKHKTDSVSQGWKRVRRRCKDYNIRLLPFKYLRKTGSQWVRDRLGLEYSQVFLAHGRESVAEEHYNDPTYEKLAGAMKAIHLEQQRMFQKVNWDEWKVRLKSKPPEAA